MMEIIPKIEMSALWAQYLKIRDEIDGAILDVIHSSVFVKGGKVIEFERHLGEYLGTGVTGCGNGTDALQLAFMGLDLQPGDEVITTPFTFIATVEVLALLHLKPVFVDVDPATFQMDVTGIGDAITERTRAILPVHLFGQNACMEEILEIAERHQLSVVEDAAQSIGADYIFRNGDVKKSGTIGIIGCTSFFPSKTLGAFGDGGAVLTSDPGLASVIRSIANHGMQVRYQYERIGINSRLDSLQAAILDVKLKYLDQYILARQEAAKWYDSHLAGTGDIVLPARVPASTHTFHQYTIQTSYRDKLKDFLKVHGIPSMVYYPRAVHLQEAYGYLGYKKGDFPVTEQLTETVLSLPMHTELDESQLDYITGIVRKFFNTQVNWGDKS
jgi:dTDP-4-amino-4,6-dideoxygalactose transaminase